MNQNVPSSDFAYRAARNVAGIAGIFSLVVLVFLLIDHGRRLVKDPLESDEYTALKEKLAKKPRDESLQKEIRKLDLDLRQAYFRQRRFTEVGGFLLLAGCCIFFVAARTVITLRRRLPEPTHSDIQQDHDARVCTVARWGTAGLAIVLAATGFLLSRNYSTLAPTSPEEVAALKQGTNAVANNLPGNQTTSPGDGGAKDAYPSDEEIARHWPRFLGPDGLGIARYQNMPTTWDMTTGKGIVWKTPVPLSGFNSPIVWGDRLFLAGADKGKQEVYCFETKEGKLLWKKDVPPKPVPEEEMPDLESPNGSGWAAPTMTTDGRRVFAMFPLGDVVAFNFSGDQVWSRSFGCPKNQYGHASSLVMYRNLLYLQIDQGVRKEKLSKLHALDAATGKTAWEVKRETINSWSTPIVAPIAGKPTLVTTGEPWVIAYNPLDGKEIWRANCLRQEIGPSPVVAGGVVYVVGQAPSLSAIRAEGTGDITATNIIWTDKDNLADTCTPVATERFVIQLASEGIMTCYDAKHGKKLWEQEFEGHFQATPVLVGKNLYLFAQDGKAWIVEPSETGCKIVFETKLSEGCSATPAFLDGRFYLRSKTHLYCIGK